MSEAAKRDRSPSFPYMPLTKALERTATLLAKVKRHEARVPDIAIDWGLSVNSSSVDRTVGALLAYGLIEDCGGSGAERRIKVSDPGWRILEDARPGVRESLLAHAAMRPKSIAEYAERWKGGRPDDSHAISQLKFEGGFTDEGARTFVRVFDDAMRFISAPAADMLGDNEMGPEADASVADPVGVHLMQASPNGGGSPAIAAPPMALPNASENEIKIMLDGDRLRVSAVVDLKGAKRLMKALTANMALLEDEDEDE